MAERAQGTIRTHVRAILHARPEGMAYEWVAAMRYFVQIWNITSVVDERRLAYTRFYGRPFDFGRQPLLPFGTEVEVMREPLEQISKAEERTERAFYLGPAQSMVDTVVCRRVSDMVHETRFHNHFLARTYFVWGDPMARPKVGYTDMETAAVIRRDYPDMVLSDDDEVSRYRKECLAQYDRGMRETEAYVEEVDREEMWLEDEAALNTAGQRTLEEVERRQMDDSAAHQRQGEAAKALHEARRLAKGAVKEANRTAKPVEQQEKVTHLKN